MNNTFPDIPQVLVPLSLAPAVLNENKNHVKPKKNNYKEKNQQNQAKQPRDTNISHKYSKSESHESNQIEDQFKFNQNFMDHNMAVNNQQSSSSHLPSKAQRVHTVFSHSSVASSHEVFKSPFINEHKPNINKKDMIHNQNKISKMKTSASQPVFSSNSINKPTENNKKNNINNNNNNQNNKNFQNTIYDNYLNNEEVKKGLEQKTLFQGQIRINQRNYEDSFINDPVNSSFFSNNK
jgi:hypothetical protein